MKILETEKKFYDSLMAGETVKVPYFIESNFYWLRIAEIANKNHPDSNGVGTVGYFGKECLFSLMTQGKS